MDKKPDLYAIRITCAHDEVEGIELLFEDDCLSLSSFAPPRSAEATVEILVDGKPSDSYILGKLAPYPNHTIKPVEDIDWVKKVADDFPPIKVARWTIYGGTHKDEVIDKTYGLQIDATSAFGTGEHPTTAGCLDYLDDLLVRVGDKAKNWHVLDMGCGSGILSMAFAKAVPEGSSITVGVDFDEHSIEIANENAEINGVADKLKLVINMGYKHEVVAENAPYDLIMANIFADPLCEMAHELTDHLKPGGYAILSGILTTQADAVITSHIARGLKLEKKCENGEWSILELSKPMEA